MRSLLLGWWFCCLALTLGAAPRYAIRDYSTRDGLSQRRVSDILQDQRGLIWLSTWNGLTRFDGASFVRYTNATGSHGRLYNNRINFICANSLGDIWCGTNDARAWLFDTYTERYLDILAPIEERMGRRFEVTLIFPLEKGVTWVLCEEGYAFRMQDTLVKRGEGITLYSHREGTLPGKVIQFVAQDDNGNEWILTDGGVVMAGDRKPVTTLEAAYFVQNEEWVLLASQQGKLCLFNKQSSSFSYPTPFFGAIHSVIPLDDATFALATDTGAILCDPASGNFRRYDITRSGIASGEVAELYADSQGGLWAITPEKGIVRIDRASGACSYVLAHREPITSTFPPYSVWEDPYGTVWVIPLVAPIRYWDPAGEVLRFVESDQPAHSSFVGRYYPDAQGNLWIAHSNGLSHLSFSKDYARYIPEDKDYETRALMVDSRGDTWSGSKSGAVRRYDSRSGAVHYLSPSGKLSASFSKLTSVGTGIYALMEDSAGNLYIGTRGDGLYILSPHGRMTHYRHDSAVGSNAIYSICEDARGRIWVGCFSGGINLLQGHGSGPVRFINSRNRLRHYPIERFGAVRHITQGPDGVMLVGTTQGLLTFDGSTDDYENLHFHTTVHSLNEREGLAGVNVMHILPTRRGEVFVMSFDGSIQQIVGTDLLSGTLRFRSYRTAYDRTIPELALAAIEDRDGQMWVVSEDALTRFDAARERFEPLHADLLVRGNYFTEAIPALARSGELLIGTYGGILAFDPRRMIRQSDVPPIVFTEITLQGKSAERLYRCDSLRIAPDERDLQIGFVALDYLDAVSIRYAYRLEGLESEWNYTLENRAVSYVNLPRGKYRFQVRSTNNRGVWVDNTLTLPIEVLPRFGETVWAWLLYGLGIVCLSAIVALTIFYVYRLRSRSQMERQMADIKLRFFTDISHELRTPLTLIASPVSEVLEEQSLSPTARDHLQVVKRNVERMLLLVNQILDFRKIQNKKMRLLVEHLDLVGQLRATMEPFRLIAGEKQINFRLEHDSPAVMCWVDSDKFEKILFNLLSNAFKFTPAHGSIVVRVAQAEGQVVVSVIDTGVGIPASQIERLFERFESASAYNSLQPSSGIGLSMVRELVLLHHGRIEVFSRQGEQTELRITLPLGRAHFEQDDSVEFIVSDGSEANEEAPATTPLPPVVPEENPEPKDKADPRSAVSLLIVEDNAELVAFLTGVLGRDYRVLTASNGREGLEKAFGEQPDFILTDVMMPLMDGLEMIGAIKQHPELCHIPIVVLSARSSLGDRIHALEYGIDDYITKPFSVPYLRTRVATLIESRRRMQEQLLRSLSQGASVGISPAKPLVVPFDRHFMEQLMAFMEQQMDNAELTVDDLAAAGDVSRTILYRKLRTIVGLSPIDFIRKIRIERAKQLIDTGEFTFSQAAYMSGFGDPKYFSKCFKKETGLTPSEYKSKKRKEA